MILFDFFKKQQKLENKRKIIKILVDELLIPEEQKNIFLKALDILDEKGLDNLYKELVSFIKNLELKEIEDIRKNNFVEIAGMRKKEAEKKKKEINAFSFLINKI